MIVSVSLPLASLMTGFFASNFIGQAIVVLQILLSLWALQIVFFKHFQFRRIRGSNVQFVREFAADDDVLSYYLRRRGRGVECLESIYKKTCERMVTLIDPETRNTMISAERGKAAPLLGVRELELVRGTCDHVADEARLKVESHFGHLGTIVSIAPMLGLLGTVWGVLDAFERMGGTKTALLSEIAPSISSALVTTVVGLLVAIPAAIFYNRLNDAATRIETDIDGFRDELLGRIGREYSGKVA